ncbi:hypothetical protein B5S33_g4590 [[Candida] boidinii]|nr:hypothetical protein B5S30_g5180 [[Candida] boidinii]OWB85914.1 hypothetical protein B5S33_g4590 [[Candida] boidinii]
MINHQQQQQAEVSVATDSQKSIEQEVHIKKEVQMKQEVVKHDIDTDTGIDRGTGTITNTGSKGRKANIIHLSFNEFELLFETISDLRRLGFNFDEILNNCDNVDFYNLKTIFEFYSIPVNTHPPQNDHNLNVNNVISNKRKLSISSSSESHKRVKKFDTPEWLHHLTINVSSDESDESDIEAETENNYNTNYINKNKNNNNNNDNNSNSNIYTISNNNSSNKNNNKSSNIFNHSITTHNNSNSGSNLQMMAIQKRIDELERNKKQRESSVENDTKITSDNTSKGQISEYLKNFNNQINIDEKNLTLMENKINNINDELSKLFEKIELLNKENFKFTILKEKLKPNILKNKFILNSIKNLHDSNDSILKFNDLQKLNEKLSKEYDLNEEFVSAAIIYDDEPEYTSDNDDNTEINNTNTLELLNSLTDKNYIDETENDQEIIPYNKSANKDNNNYDDSQIEYIDRNIPPEFRVIKTIPKSFKEYTNSSLKLFKSYRFHPNFNTNLLTSSTWSNKIEPNKPFCFYELISECTNKDCQFQHYKDIVLTGMLN